MKPSMPALRLARLLLRRLRCRSPRRTGAENQGRLLDERREPRLRLGAGTDEVPRKARTRRRIRQVRRRQCADARDRLRRDRRRVRRERRRRARRSPPTACRSRSSSPPRSRKCSSRCWRARRSSRSPNSRARRSACRRRAARPTRSRSALLEGNYGLKAADYTVVPGNEPRLAQFLAQRRSRRPRRCAARPSRRSATR